jgi:hypothetical protein
MLKNIPLFLLFFFLFSPPCFSTEEEGENKSDYLDDSIISVQDILNYLPCKNSSPKCINQLTQLAIANSAELITIEERIKMIEERLKLMERKIKYSRNRSWTNYITLDPIELIQNIFGGGGVQRDRIALADLDVSVGQLEAAKAELERQKERQKAVLEAEVLRLVLDYEASSRRRDLIKVQLSTFQKQQQIGLISYRLGQGSTNEYLNSQLRGEQLQNNLLECGSFLTQQC